MPPPEPTKGPLEYQPEKRLDRPLIDVLVAIRAPESLLFTVKPGGPGALMGTEKQCWKVPPKWMAALVTRGFIHTSNSRSSRVASMGWIEYLLTYEGQQEINRRV